MVDSPLPFGQGHHLQYSNHLEELVPRDVARALADNPVTIPDADSVCMGIDSLTMSIRPFDELNQFRTRCFTSFASHQKRNLSLTQVVHLLPAMDLRDVHCNGRPLQVLKLYVAAYQEMSIVMSVLCRSSSCTWLHTRPSPSGSRFGRPYTLSFRPR